MTDREFLAAFEAASIPRAQWTHRAHVRTAYLYVRDWPLSEAIVKIRSGIKALNTANGVQDTPTNGYHETVTIAWATVVADRIQRQPTTGMFDEFAEANADLFGQEFLSQYYSRERLFSAEARATFVAPDRARLPGPIAMEEPWPQ